MSIPVACRSAHLHLNVFAKPSAAGAKQTEAVIYAKMSIEMFVNPPISVEQLNRIVDLRSPALAVHHFDSKTPHFRHVVVRTFRLGSYIVVGWFGGSGHVDGSVFCDHGFTWRSGASDGLRKSIATRKYERREHFRSFHFAFR